MRGVVNRFGEQVVHDGVDHTSVEGLSNLAYSVPNLQVELSTPTNIKVPVLWWRSVGHTHTGYVAETMIDEAAVAALSRITTKTTKTGKTTKAVTARRTLAQLPQANHLREECPARLSRRTTLEKDHVSSWTIRERFTGPQSSSNAKSLE